MNDYKVKGQLAYQHVSCLLKLISSPLLIPIAANEGSCQTAQTEQKLHCQRMLL